MLDRDEGDRELLEVLGTILAEQDLLTGEAVAARPAAWGSERSCEALAIARPRSTEQVSAVLRACWERRRPVVTQGGVTGLVRGAVAGPAEVVLSTDRLTEIEELDETGRTITAQSGVTLERIQQAADSAGLKFPLDLGARAQCTIGGNVSTNAGGNHVIRYGMTRAQVLGLEAVLADGTVIADRSKMLKNNAGYDLKQLFIGSEGTLGVVTKVVLRLQAKPRTTCTGFAAVNGFERLVALLQRAQERLGADLAAFEVLWPEFYELVTTAPAKNQPPLPRESDFYVIVEALGSRPDADAEHFSATLADCIDDGLVEDAVVALSPADRQRIWAMRDDIEQLQRLAPIFTFDVSLPVGEMEDYVAEVRRGVAARWPEAPVIVFGHLGDGNLHVVVGPGEAGSEVRRAVESCVYEPLRERDASISAEHGVGLEKQPYLDFTRGPAEIGMMRALKEALDPRGILNPGRVVPPE